MNDNIVGDFEAFQRDVMRWYLLVFDCHPTEQRRVRNFRFLEEAVELVQSLGMTETECQQILAYVFGRPVGEPFQEVGGTITTLAALCEANHIDLQRAAWKEIGRCWQPEVMEKIRNKQKMKPNPDAVLPANVDGQMRRGATYRTRDGRKGVLISTHPHDGALYVFNEVEREDDDIMVYFACERDGLVEVE